MSHKVITLVCSRIVGSQPQKAVLTNMADKASDGGEGVFASKATIAAETELGLSTVKRAIKDLLDRGLIREVGQRGCANGHTVVYDLDVRAISALPEWKTEERTPSRADPVQSGRGPERTVTPSRADPHPVQSGPLTVLEPSLNKEAAEARAREAGRDLLWDVLHALGFDRGQTIPKYWMGADAPMIVSQWQTDLGLTSDEIQHVARQNAIQFGAPANGPKILTRHMQDFAAAKNAAPLQPTPAIAKGHRHDRVSETRAFDRSINAVADGLSAGTIQLDFASRDPFSGR